MRFTGTPPWRRGSLGGRGPSTWRCFKLLQAWPSRLQRRCFEYNEIPLVYSKPSAYVYGLADDTSVTRGKVVTAGTMDHDDDVEHLFSWLQTPELRYREFAGAREITDAVVIVQQQRASNTPVPQDEPVDAPHHDARLDEEYPEDQFPDQGETRVEAIREAQPPAREIERVVVREESRIEVREDARSAGRGPLIIAPVPMDSGESAPLAGAGVFALDAGGRSSLRSGPAEWAGPRPPLIQTPVARPAMPPAAASGAAPPAAAPPRPAAAPAGGLLGGAYRENGTNGHSVAPAAAEAPEPAEGPVRNERSLDAVFGRLSGGRGRLPDPRERLRHIPGLGPPAGRPR